MNPQMKAAGYDPNDAVALDYNREVYFRRHRVQPPGMVYVTVDDLFVLKVFNPSVAANVNVSIRYLDAAGEVLPQFQQFQNIPASGTVHTFNFRGSEGYVLSATISTPGASGGAVYVQLEVGRGAGSQDLTEGHLLIAGYPGSFAALGYPQTQPLPPNAGAGFTRSVTVTNPAAGADWSITVPTGASWTLNGVSALFTASAAVANRLPEIVLVSPGGTNLFVGTQNTFVTASQAITFMTGGNQVTLMPNANLAYVATNTSIRLQAGAVIKSVTTGIQAGDQWSNIVLQVQEQVAA